MSSLVIVRHAGCHFFRHRRRRCLGRRSAIVSITPVLQIVVASVVIIFFGSVAESIVENAIVTDSSSSSTSLSSFRREGKHSSVASTSVPSASFLPSLSKLPSDLAATATATATATAAATAAAPPCSDLSSKSGHECGCVRLPRRRRVCVRSRSQGRGNSLIGDARRLSLVAFATAAAKFGDGDDDDDDDDDDDNDDDVNNDDDFFALDDNDGENKKVGKNRMARDIDGKAIAAKIRSEIKSDIKSHLDRRDIQRPPGLAVVLVGNRADSQTYVRMKQRACEECGMTSFLSEFPDTVSQSTLLDKVRELNDNNDVDGILVQLPLPSHVDEGAVLDAIRPDKDVDGLHPINVARLCSTSTHAKSTKSDSAAAKIVKVDWSDLTSVPFHIPCTPQGCIELLDRCGETGIDLCGKNAVVIGRSNLVGLPVAMLLMHRDATVTIVHSKTVNAPSIVRTADIVVAAIGRAELVRGDWIKDGAVVIDVGINSVDDPTSKRGYRLVGDVRYDEVKEKAEWITPVPGGVGPMTIAMLLRNTLNSCRRRFSSSSSSSSSSSRSGGNDGTSDDRSSSDP